MTVSGLGMPRQNCPGSQRQRTSAAVLSTDTFVVSSPPYKEGALLRKAASTLHPAIHRSVLLGYAIYSS